MNNAIKRKYIKKESKFYHFIFYIVKEIENEETGIK